MTTAADAHPDASASSAAARRWPRRLLWLVLAVGVVIVALAESVAPLMRHLLPRQASAALGRAVTVGAVHFEPRELTLTLRDVAIAGASPQAPALLQARRVQASLALGPSLRHRAPVLDALTIEAPRVQLSRLADGRSDIDDVLERLAQRPHAVGDAGPARFALYNVRLLDGQIRLDDRVVGRHQRIDALTLGLPFLSSLPADVQVHVDPRLALRLNGVPIDSGAQALPFARTRSGDLRIAFQRLDLAPWLPYLPSSLALRPVRGVLGAELTARFAMPPGGPPSLQIRGKASAEGLELRDGRGAPAGGWKALSAQVRRLDPFARQVELAALDVQGLAWTVRRGADGRVEMLPRGDAAPTATSAAAEPGWRVRVDALGLQDATLGWEDAHVRPQATFALTRLALRAAPLAWPWEEPAQVTLTADVLDRALPATAPPIGRLHAEGPVTDRSARIDARLEGLSLPALRPYLSPHLAAAVDGTLEGQARIDWGGEPDPHLRVALPSLTLKALALHEPPLRPGAAPALAWQQLALVDTEVDLDRRRVTIGRADWRAPRLDVLRAADGRLSVESWLPPPVRGKAAPEGPPWTLDLRHLALEDGRLGWRDEKVRDRLQRPVALALTGLQGHLGKVRWDGRRVAAPVEMSLRSRLVSLTEVGRAPRRGQATPPDRREARATLPRAGIDLHGTLALSPWRWQGRAQVERLPVAVLAPYALPPTLRAELLSADATYAGSLDVGERPAGLALAARGQARLAGVRVASRLVAGAASASVLSTDPAADLLAWQALALQDLQVQVEPGRKPRIDVGHAALEDFFARLMITPEGRFNLQDITGEDAGPTPPEAAASAAVAAAPAASASARPAAELPVVVSIGGIALKQGKVDFNDRFIQPNYSAELTELNGQVGALRSDRTEMAAIELRGRAAGTALLDIQGRINPLLKPLAMDLKARASDLELAPLSPYAGKYAGYGIERGKLTMQVAYRIEPDGKLDASNQIILNQLTFGDKVDSPSATKLPVRLAVALLKDRHGVIDLNLPVTGSVNDPQFSVGSLIWRLLGNLIVKAVTSPFSLFEAGGGPGDSGGSVAFLPGTSRFADAAGASLDRVAQALKDRPALKLTIAGGVDAQAERAAFQQATLDARLQAEAQREALRAGRATAVAAPRASAPADDVGSTVAAQTAARSVASSEAVLPALGAAQRAALVEQLYARTELPGKPRNALGLARSLPAAEMEALLRAQVPVDESTMRELALQRGLKARDALIARGLPGERVFLAAPRLHAARAEAAASKPAPVWTPRAELSLSVD